MTLLSSKRLRGQEGQATTEFALTLILIMAFILFFVQFSLVMAWGNYVHYATFMSARAYLSAGPTDEDQEQRAEAVAIRMLKRSGETGRDRYPVIGEGVSENDTGASQVTGLFVKEPDDYYDRKSKNSSWMEGVRYTFRSKVFMMPLAGSSRSPSGTGATKKDATNSVTLTSESWLGKDPSAESCRAYMQKVKGLVDNGC